MKPGGIIILTQENKDLPAVSGYIAEGEELFQLGNDVVPGQVGKTPPGALRAAVCRRDGSSRT